MPLSKFFHVPSPADNNGHFHVVKTGPGTLKNVQFGQSGDAYVGDHNGGQVSITLYDHSASPTGTVIGTFSMTSAELHFDCDFTNGLVVGIRTAASSSGTVTVVYL